MNDLLFIYSEKLWLELSEKELELALQISNKEHYSHAATCWNAYLNCLCCNAFLNWLQEDPELWSTPKVWPNSQDLSSFWEFVNGTCLTIGEIRLVLIPSDKSNITEFRIPEEWVDLPSWVANYYLAVQINLEEHWLGLWGYTTHQNIREKAKYDQLDRTYVLDEEDLITDINVIWVAHEVCPPRQPEVENLPTLSRVRVNKLLQQLSYWTAHLPINVSHKEWMAILGADQSRQELYQKRLLNQQLNKIESHDSSVNNLNKWFENVFEGGWSSFDTFLSSQSRKLAVQFRSESALNEIRIKGAKLIDLGMQLRNTAVVLLVALTSETDEKVSIRVQLHPADEEIYLPPDLKLLLLSASGNILQEVHSRNHDHFIQLKKFKSSLGKKFSLQVALGDISIKEDFVLGTLVGL